MNQVFAIKSNLMSKLQWLFIIEIMSYKANNNLLALLITICK